MLYVLCIEVLCLEIKNNPQVKGLEYLSKQYKDQAFADDLSILTTSTESISKIFNILGKFEKATNAKINVDKTEGLWIGTWKNNTITPMGLKWTNTMVKCLGVFVGNNRKIAERESFVDLIEKMKTKIKFWKGKGISLKGKIRVTNILILSKLWYVSRVKDIPQDLLAEINRLISDFIWEGKFHQRSLLGLEMNYDKGGMRLLSIEKRIKIFRIKMLFDILSKPNDHLEQFLVNFLISENKHKIGLDILKGSTLSVINTIRNEFYKNACKAWINLGIKYIPPSKESIKNLCIYENSLLKDINGRVFKSLNRTRNLPRTFDDLPFPILNRSHDVGLFIRSLNNSLNMINYGTEAYFIENGEDRIELKGASCKTLYWIYLNKAEVSLPWKPKRKHYLQTWKLIGT